MKSVLLDKRSEQTLHNKCVGTVIYRKIRCTSFFNEFNTYIILIWTRKCTLFGWRKKMKRATHLVVLPDCRDLRRAGTSSLSASRQPLLLRTRSAARSAAGPTSTGSAGPSCTCRPRKTWCAAWSTGSCRRWPVTPRPRAPWRKPAQPIARGPRPAPVRDTGRGDGTGSDAAVRGDRRGIGESNDGLKSWRWSSVDHLFEIVSGNGDREVVVFPLLSRVRRSKNWRLKNIFRIRATSKKIRT